MSKSQTVSCVKQLYCEWHIVADKVQNFLRIKSLRKDDVLIIVSAYDNRSFLVLIVYDEEEKSADLK